MPAEPKAESLLEKTFAIAPKALEGALGEALSRRLDDADCYLEYRAVETISLEDGIVKRASQNLRQGAGVRAVSGDKQGYAHTDDVNPKALLEAATVARAIARESGRSQIVAVKGAARPDRDLYPVTRTALEVPTDQKVKLLQEMDRMARGLDPRIVQVMAGLSCEEKTVVIARPDGKVLTDRQPLSRLNVTCIAQEGKRREIGTWGGGGRCDYTYFTEGDRWKGYVKEAVRIALLNLQAVDAPAGMMDVVLGNGWTGILLHEAIGHPLEGDFNRKGSSLFSGRVGQKVASPLCTIVDDGSLQGRRGSLNMDDEGTPTQRTVLIEKGVLKGYMQDRMNARLMGVPATGNGRRESYAHLPMPRMTNTFMEAGEESPADVIKSVKKGLYAVGFSGGQVDITSGNFVFSATEAYELLDGKIGRPVKGATLIGNGPDVLTRISRVANDLKLDEGIGTCGKNAQSVPVGVGLPTLRIDGITVGGTQA